MRTARLIGGSLQIAGFTLGMFGMPLGLLGLGGIDALTSVVVDTAEEARVVYLPPPPPSGGGADAVADTVEAESHVDDLLASTSGTKIPSGKASTGKAVGSGAGSAGGTGYDSRMPRPDGAPDGPSNGRGRRERDCADPTPGITKNATGSWTVTRDLVDLYAGHPSKIDELGSVGKHAGPDGKSDGFQLHGIRCGTPLHQAGLRSGDVVNEINGEVVTNVLQAIMVYGKVRKADAIEVVITRKGERRTLSYQVT